MKLLRHFFLSDSLDDLEVFDEQLEAAGVSSAQIHVLTMDDTDAENHHHLHDVQSLMKKDVIRSMMIGAVIGIVSAALVLVIAYMAGWNNTAAGWIPFIFLAVVILGFSTWEGGLYGIQTPNHHFKQFEADLQQGKHVFFVDLEENQEDVLEKFLKLHPNAKLAGTGPATPAWILWWQRKGPTFLRNTLP